MRYLIILMAISSVAYSQCGIIALNPITGMLDCTGPAGGGEPTGAAGGVLSGTYPNPGLATSVALPGSPTTTTQTQGDTSTKVATTAYTDTAVSNALAGVNPAVAVLAASIANITGTYSNGAAGVGATFTVTATGAFTLDGIAINTIGQRVLLKNQSTGFQNGVYTATVVGASLVSPVFTRALDYDTPSNINSTGAIPVQSGTVNTTTSWLLTSTVTTVGTDALTYVQFSLAPSSVATCTGDLSGTAPGCTVSKINGTALSGLGTGILKNTTTTGVPSIALAADTVAQFSGSCPSGAQCALGSDGVIRVVSAFPYAYQRGTFLGMGLSLNSSSSVTSSPFSDTFTLTTVCTSSAGSASYQLPIGGFVRNIAGTTGITNATSPIRWGISPNCSFATATVGAAITPAAAAAGGVVDSNITDWWHLSQWSPLGMGFVRQGLTNTAAPISETAEFISDDGLQATLIGDVYTVTLAASTTQYWGPAAPVNTTEANTTLPIPIAGTFKNLFIATGNAPTATVAVTFRKNLAATTLTTTVGTTDTGGVSYDTTHTVSVVAGDNISLETISGASTQAAFQAWGAAFIPTTPGDTFIWGSFGPSTVTTTNKYALPFSPLVGTTIAAMEATMPFACTISNLYVYQAAANGGSTVTTFTLMKNGSTTALTGTVGVGVTGSVLVDGTHSVSYAQGDLITLQHITNTGTSGNMAGWSAKCN